MNNYYLLMNIQSGDQWIDEVLQGSADDIDYLRRLNGEPTFETPHWIVAGPLTNARAHELFREIE